jgi:hypothetical protein
MRQQKVDKATYYRGIRMVPYDLVKELAVAMAATLVLILILSAVLSSPDVPSLTIQSWAQNDPADFVTTASSELAGTSTSSDYGPPYNSNSGSVQTWGFFQPQTWAGVHQPVDSAGQFVLMPLQLAAGGNAQVKDALTTYQAASPDQQSAWLTAYTMALGNATVQNGDVVVASGDYGPVPTLMSSELRLAQNGALDGLLLESAHFYQTDYTAPLLFMGDSGYFASLAEAQHLTGSQWGVMNETGRYPGQAWLWLYTMWYQVAPFNLPADQGVFGVSAANTDLAVVVVMAILTLLLIFIPFIPGLRDIPRWIPIHRLIWRRYYAEERERHI